MVSWTWVQKVDELNEREIGKEGEDWVRQSNRTALSTNGSSDRVHDDMEVR
jgi:hypothetical protein